MTYQTGKDTLHGSSLFDAVLGCTTDPILVVDHDLRLIAVNPAGRRLLAGGDRDLTGTLLSSLPNGDQLVALIADLVKGASHDSAQSGAPYQPDAHYSGADGHVYEPHVVPFRGSDGQQGWVLNLRDITRFKRLHDNMTNFLSTVSHDMRTPLTFMRGYLDMMGMVGSLNERQHSFVEKITDGVLQMSDLVEKVLDAGNLDPMTGTYDLMREPTDILEVLEAVVNSIASAADKKQIRLEQRCDPGIPIVNVDRALLTSAFTNLAENAVKYTPREGEVLIEVRVIDDALVFSVRDNGYGISQADQARLFQRNVRIRRKEWARVKGTGLGLFIAMNVARRHGGVAWVESEEGQGSVFGITIPLSGANLVGGERAADDD